jgi:hypothetical protein
MLSYANNHGDRLPHDASAFLSQAEDKFIYRKLPDVRCPLGLVLAVNGRPDADGLCRVLWSDFSSTMVPQNKVNSLLDEDDRLRRKLGV